MSRRHAQVARTDGHAYTSGEAPYGIYLDEVDDDHPTGMIPQAHPASYPASVVSTDTARCSHYGRV
jgi:hypothetical protein